ncbi:MAG: hypothetical protein GX751_03340 [Desulfuromonadaceae bacterium]|nr:hypothetical protein [Desulfuromonadaceae bacterium]
MLSGKDTLQVINEQIRQTQGDIDSAGRQLDAASQRVAALSQEMSNAYRRLAQSRLNDLLAKRVMGKLDEVDHATLKILERRHRALEELRQRIEGNLLRQKHLENQRKALAAERDAAGKAWQARVEKAWQAIRASEAYAAQSKQLEKVEEILHRAEEKALQAEEDRKVKGIPYESDPLFMYLWKRRFLTPDYVGGRLVRSLDDWVSRLIDFPRNRANYHLLVEIPRHLKEHAGTVKEKAEQEAQALAEIEEKEMAAEGVAALHAQVEELEKKLAAHDAEIDAEEARYRELIDEQGEFGQMADTFAAQALDLQEQNLKGESLNVLFEEALQTAGAEDDNAVARIQELKREIDFRRTEIHTLQELQNQRQRSLVEMESLRRRYRQEGYDAYHTTFPGNFSMGELLAQLLAGALSSETVWREIGRHHRSLPRTGGIRLPSGTGGRSWGGSWPSGRSGGDQRPSRGGGFRTGGTF